jgi:hypothetical protein
MSRKLTYYNPHLPLTARGSWEGYSNRERGASEVTLEGLICCIGMCGINLTKLNPASASQYHNLQAFLNSG